MCVQGSEDWPYSTVSCTYCRNDGGRDGSRRRVSRMTIGIECVCCIGGRISTSRIIASSLPPFVTRIPCPFRFDSPPRPVSLYSVLRSSSAAVDTMSPRPPCTPSDHSRTLAGVHLSTGSTWWDQEDARTSPKIGVGSVQAKAAAIKAGDSQSRGSVCLISSAK